MLPPEFLSEINTFILTIGAVVGTIFLGYKKLNKHGAQLSLDTAKANTERGVIEMIYVRLKELEEVNKNLTQELEMMRKEHAAGRLQNELLNLEIRNLKEYIELNFTPTQY